VRPNPHPAERNRPQGERRRMLSREFLVRAAFSIELR
jgi:hypothetical protein